MTRIQQLVAQKQNLERENDELSRKLFDAESLAETLQGKLLDAIARTWDEAARLCNESFGSKVAGNMAPVFYAKAAEVRRKP